MYILYINNHNIKYLICSFSLKWARENRCQWNEDTCSSAARGEHLDVLKWARENGCPE